MNKNSNKGNSFIRPADAWALGLGTSIGWGSLVITSSTYLFQAGPAGSIIGLVIGTVIMLVIAYNYHYMINCYPDRGGAYAYTREVFGNDQAFLTGWFMMLTYFAMLWANATSLPLFARYFIGDMFKVGRMYSLFGYDVYLGEVLISACVLALTAFIMIMGQRPAMRLMTVLAGVFTFCIMICFVACLLSHEGNMEPAYIPEKDHLAQVIKIASISPWAFIGFENISNASEEFTFSRKKTMRVLTMAVIIAAILYGAIIIMSVTAYPPEYSSWLEYISDRDNLDGIKGLPAFYAAQHYMGSAGVHLLMTALLALILTSLIGNLFTLSRIFMALSKDEILPAGVGKLNDKGTPAKAIMAAAGISMIMPFVGRTAIGWIVDVTTIGAVIVYGFVSASSYKMAKTHGTRTERDLGLAGLVIMIAFGAYLLIPNLFGEGGMEPASYFLFVIWSVLGFVFFRRLLLKDKEKRYGRTIVVWIALLSLILFISLVWMSQTSMETSRNVLMETSEVYGAGEAADEGFISEKLDYMMWRQGLSLLLVIGLFGFSLAILMSNYSVISKRAEESERELGHVRDLANKDPLTGVKSKLAFREKEAELDKLIVSGELGDLSLAVLDVNGLKHINDTYGHKAGDAYILSASRLICEIFLHSPVYRIGGDEFAVILTGHDRECREELVAKFNKAVEDNLSDGGVVVSIGFSDYHADRDQNLHEVFVRADELMYRRKQQLKSMGARTRE